MGRSIALFFTDVSAPPLASVDGSPRRGSLHDNFIAFGVPAPIRIGLPDPRHEVHCRGSCTGARPCGAQALSGDTSALPMRSPTDGSMGQTQTPDAANHDWKPGLLGEGPFGAARGSERRHPNDTHSTNARGARSFGLLIQRCSPGRETDSWVRFPSIAPPPPSRRCSRSTQDTVRRERRWPSLPSILFAVGCAVVAAFALTSEGALRL